MNITREQLKLYAVTDRSWLGSETLYEQVEKALKGGVTLVQLREKTLDEAAFEKEGQELLELCHHYNVPLIINDNVELAKKIHADGVHIGQSDMEIKNARELLGADKIIGVTAPVREAFIADCCDLIDAYQPAFWIHGHSHVSGNVQYGRTRIVSNQLGTVRPGKELNFNPKAVIEV